MEKKDFFEQESILREDRERIKAFYPKNAAVIQHYVEDVCDRMDYEGSRMYDEYPDRYMMHRVCDSIYHRIKRDGEKLRVEAGDCKSCSNLPKEALQDLIEVLFFHEVGRRRSNRRRCKKCSL